MNFAGVKAGVALRIHDPSKNELTDAQLGTLINQAIDDLTAAGIVLPLAEDESLTIASGTFTYSVPASFAYVRELRLESTTTSDKYPNAVHPSLWRLTIETGSTPVIYFNENEFDSATHDSKSLKVIGQKRVAQLTSSDTVPPGLEGFIRERTVAYAAEFVAGGQSELAQQRRRLSEVAWARSNEILTTIPREYRPLPDAKRVPER